MTPELLRDVEALCDAVMEEPVQNDYELGFRECVFCGEYIRMGARKPIDHNAGCPVLLAKRIREKLRDAYQCQHLKFTTTPLNPGIELGLTSYQPLGEPIKIRHIRQCDFCGKQLQDDGEWR